MTFPLEIPLDAPHVRVVRWAHSEDWGTFGHLFLKNNRWFSLELPWKENQKGISCIPTGTYRMKLDVFYGGDGPGGAKKDYPAYELIDVPNRTEVKIHIANTVDDLNGCLTVGLARGFLKGNTSHEDKWAVLKSGDNAAWGKGAFTQFMEAMGGAKLAWLTVENTKVHAP